MAGRARTLVLVVLVVVVAAGAAGWWFFLRDDAPEEAALDVKTDCAVSGGPVRPNGAWTVQPPADAEEGFVGYRIKEVFAGETITKTAVGRTAGVEGSMAVQGRVIDDVEITADLRTLSSGEPRRDSAIQDDGLEIEKFPEASFASTEPTRLPAAPKKGTAVSTTLSGELTLHGETKPVEVPVEACWTGGTIRVSGSAPIVLADYGIEQIETPIVDIEDHGAFEFELTLVPA